MEITAKEFEDLSRLNHKMQLILDRVRRREEVEPVEIETVLERVPTEELHDEFNELSDLLNSSAWPEAVNPEYICQDTEADKVERAQGILDSFPIKPGGGFLDFGCGEGHLVKELSKAKFKKSRVAVGYDIEDHDSWDHRFTTSFDEVVKRGPYRSILLYDVLDHAQKESPVAILEKAKKVLRPDGTIYIRVHPWCCRHAMHTYHSMNRAFVHLVFKPQELEQLGIKPTPTLKVIHPIWQYSKWIKEAGLIQSQRELVERVPVEDFFQSPPVRSRIVSHWAESPDKLLSSGEQFPTKQLEVTFIDYRVKKRV